VISELIHDCRASLLVVSFAAFGVADVYASLNTRRSEACRLT